MNAKSSFVPLLLCLALAAPAAAAQQPSRWSLDAIVDSRGSDANGLPVLAVTPGGAAQRMGIAAGDRILAINGRPLASVALPARALDEALRAADGRAEVLLLRDGQRMTLRGGLSDTSAVPARRGCGYASDRDPTPRVTERVYPGEVTQVDGRSTPLTRDHDLRLTPGKHVLVMRQLIPAAWLNASQQRARVLMEKRLQAKAYKAIVIDVAPDTRYSVGARLLRDRLDNASIRDNAYWEPVVFATRAQPCR